MLGGIDPNIFEAMMGGKNKDMGDVFANMNKGGEEPKEEPKKREPTPEKKAEKKVPSKPTSSDPAENLKNEGNEFYKKKEFEAAL